MKDSQTHNKALTDATREMSRYEGEPLWSEVMPGLWQGGTHDTDVTLYGGGIHSQGITIDDFDFVTTMYASAKPVDWFVQEIRFGIYDSDMKDFDVQELLDVVGMTYRAWKRGKRVLVRCQAGWNRSGLVTALVLMRDGFSAQEAISLLRERRSPYALCNVTFERWLITEAPRVLGIAD